MDEVGLAGDGLDLLRRGGSRAIRRQRGPSEVWTTVGKVRGSAELCEVDDDDEDLAESIDEGSLETSAVLLRPDDDRE